LSFKLVYFHPQFFSSQRSYSFRSFCQSFHNDRIANFSSFISSFLIIDLLAQNLNNYILIQYFLIQLFDKLASLMLFTEIFNRSFFFLQDLDRIKKRFDLFSVELIQSFIKYYLPFIFPSACSSMFRYSSIYFCLSERADSKVPTLNFS